MNNQDALKKTADSILNSATVKIFSIGFLILVLLIPTAMISSLMKERRSRRDSVIQEINHKWGDSQTVTGPFFTVPFEAFYKDEKDRLRSEIRYLHILPENINISGRIDTQIRYRSIYEAVLYNTQLDIKGNFKAPVLNDSNIDPEKVFWQKAVFSIGITDMRGIQDNVIITFNEKDYKANPGLKTNDIASSGLRCVIPLSPAERNGEFSLKLNLNGSRQIHFIPVGETTVVNLESTWPSPSFNGAFLPTARQVTDAGFTAEWNILHLNRNFPQFWTGQQYHLPGSSFGLELLITADIYQKSVRIVKYALIFIVFTFSAIFFSEIINKKRVHPIQYILIGFAIILFYVLLLSISEHLNFDVAYILSAVAITVLITGYSKSVLKSGRFAITIMGILTLLYAYLYIILQLEDYALLMGSLGLLTGLTIVMYITRKIDWYALNKD